QGGTAVCPSASTRRSASCDSWALNGQPPRRRQLCQHLRCRCLQSTRPSVLSQPKIFEEYRLDLLNGFVHAPTANLARAGTTRKREWRRRGTPLDRSAERRGGKEGGRR